MTALRVEAPAKVNLFLAVPGRRPDGFHEVVNVMQALELHDVVTLSLRDRQTPTDDPVADVTLTLIDDVPPLEGAQDADDVAVIPTGADNLAVRAAAALLTATGAVADHGLDIRLEKRIPSGGGLAGGSSDAGAVLTGLHTLLGEPLQDEALSALAAELGSDVPFFLVGGTALCTGRGEVVEPLVGPRPFALELLLPPWRLPTPRVYMALQAPPVVPVDPALLTRLREDLAGADVPMLESVYRNDLEAAACRVAPATSRWLDTGLHLSGSGSTFFRFVSASAGTAAHVELTRDGDPAPSFLPTRSRNR